MAVEWFCRVMGSEVGPMDQQQLVHMVRSHQLNPEDLVRRGESHWVPAFEVKGLFDAAAKPDTPQEQPPDEPDTTAPVPPQSGTQTRVDAGHVHTTDSETDNEPSASPDEFDDWFCIASGEKQGPMSFGELKALVQSGELRDKDRVWRGAAPKFKRAGEVTGLY